MAQTFTRTYASRNRNRGPQGREEDNRFSLLHIGLNSGYCQSQKVQIASLFERSQNP